MNSEKAFGYAKTNIKKEKIPEPDVAEANLSEEEQQASTSQTFSTAEASTSRQHLETRSGTRKRGKGRPSRDTFSFQAPTRASSRKRKCPNLIVLESGPVQRCYWKSTEKLELFKGLEELGSDDIQGLRTNYLPGKSEKEIKRQINMWKEIAHEEVIKKLVSEEKQLESALVNCVGKLDEWLKYMQQSESSDSEIFAFSNVFLLIAEYGKFPPPENCGGVDFRAMYRWLHCMLSGTPYYGVNRQTAEVLNNTIADFLFLLRQNLTKLQPQLINLVPRPHTRHRTYSRPPKVTANSLILESLLQKVTMNPLNMVLQQKAEPSSKMPSDDDLYCDDEFE